MKENMDINTDSGHKEESREDKKISVNRWGMFIGFCFLAAGIVWYAAEMGLIPWTLLRELAGPIILVLIGILIIIKSI